ncbi:transcriptional regulator [Vibrio lentus]|uniref:helix-turn-helix domain-containing protein n=1 Tax=Vibrio TaxID=662 RepID=UPI000C8662FA|nr:transcriptional regulator [Vibrio lentus]PMI73266.1 transcriptional regulator [Vibrio splendidus]
MNKLTKEISLKIIKQRESLRLSCSETSLKAGFSRGYLRKVELCEKRITVEKLYLLADALDCAVTDLLPDTNTEILENLRSK